MIDNFSIVNLAYLANTFAETLMKLSIIAFIIIYIKNHK